MTEKTDLNEKGPFKSFEWLKHCQLTLIFVFIISAYFFTCLYFGETQQQIRYWLGYRYYYQIRNGHCWGLLTNLLFHLNWLHFVGNFITLLLTGYWVEKYYGKIRFCYITLFGALLTPLPFIISHKGYVVGISGIIYTFWGILLSAQFFQKKLKVPILIHLILGVGFVVGFYLKAFKIMNVANSAHVVGVLLGVFLAFLFKPNEAYCIKTKKAVIEWSIAALTIITVFCYFSFEAWDRKYFHIYRNDDAGCFNCLSQIGLSLRMYSQENNEMFPAGKETSLESLNLLFGPDGERTQLANCMASHSKQQKLWEYFKKYKKIPEHLACYRYNEGLKEEAPVDSVLMYYYKPIKWACWYSPTKEKGRLILFIDGHKKFYSEAEFQKLQKATLEWIKANKEAINVKGLAEIEERFTGKKLQSWTGGQKATIMWNRNPEVHRQLLKHPNLQIRFATACCILNRTRDFREGHEYDLLGPRNGYTKEDIDKAFTVLKKGFECKDKASAGLRRYIAEHLPPEIHDKRLIEILVIALQDKDVAHGSSYLGASSSLHFLTGQDLKEFEWKPDDWKDWYEKNKDNLVWDGTFFIHKEEKSNKKDVLNPSRSAGQRSLPGK